MTDIDNLTAEELAEFREDVEQAVRESDGNMWASGADLIFRHGGGQAVLALGQSVALIARLDALHAELEAARCLAEQRIALLDALRNQGLLQNTATGVIWHVHDCPASFDFAECNYRCRVAREAFARAGTEPYVSVETRRDTEVYE